MKLSKQKKSSKYSALSDHTLILTAILGLVKALIELIKVLIE